MLPLFFLLLLREEELQHYAPHRLFRRSAAAVSAQESHRHLAAVEATVGYRSRYHCFPQAEGTLLPHQLFPSWFLLHARRNRRLRRARLVVVRRGLFLSPRHAAGHGGNLRHSGFCRIFRFRVGEYPPCAGQGTYAAVGRARPDRSPDGFRLVSLLRQQLSHAPAMAWDFASPSLIILPRP